ncbi:ABC transporter substrate-binding protein [Lentzea aerocolonigenes]|uniref:ABC transporter substrate-binding protein n=1 Tax=Lentzea aerocolonigenes TaxID=68170 RepID=UPI0027E02488|nr:ABC transporter substrate-binding protein [Lentzea aerocolonigenes]
MTAALLAACGETGGGVSSTESFHGGPGVTQDKIRLGVLSDLSGPFASGGRNVTEGNQLFVNEVNSKGGICGRKVELIVRDHAFDTEKGKKEYLSLEPEVLGFVQIVGAQITQSIEDDVLHQQVLTAPTSWNSALLDNPYMMVVGATYKVDVMNGLEYLMRQGLLSRGDTVGHLRISDEKEYGDDAVAGSTFAVTQLGLNLTKAALQNADPDMSPGIAALKQAGAKALVLSTNPRQTASAVAAAAQLGLAVPIIINNPGFAPELLQGQLAPIMERQVFVLSSVAPFDAAIPGPRQVAAEYRSTFPQGTPSMAVNYGYLVGLSFGSVLKRACEHKDFSREGVLKAFREVNSVESGGTSVPLRFSITGRPSATETFVLRPDSKVQGGLTIVANQFESEVSRRAGR